MGIQGRSLTREKLQKAIERNRKKMATRSNKSSSKNVFARAQKSHFSVGKPDNVQFSNIRSRSSSKNKGVSYMGERFEFGVWIYRAGWVVCFILVLRLLFAGNGVWDFYSMEGTLKEKQELLESIDEENLLLKEEIRKLEYEPHYQKQVAKDHLGVISANEYLILFAQD